MAINDILLEHLGDLAEERKASERRFRRALELGAGMGIPIAQLAEHAELSTSRVHAILENASRPLRPLDTEEVEYVIEHAKTVVVVPAKTAYKDYQRYSAYICQPHRTFRPETERLGFYDRREIKPEFPKTGRVWEELVFDSETVASLRASGDADEGRLADVIEHVLANQTGGRKSGWRLKVVFLSPPGPDTLTLEHPIRHRGPSAWVRRQRYVSEAALLRRPKTTDELAA